MGRKSRPLAERFWKHVEKTGTCWIWVGAIARPSGYGQINDGNKPWTMLRTHRVSWELHFGPIPDGMFVCHKCDNRRCVNPDHLFLGSNSENMADAAKKCRVSRGESRPQSKLTEADVLEIRSLSEGSTRSAADLAHRFGITATHVWRIVNGKSWAWLK